MVYFLAFLSSLFFYKIGSVDLRGIVESFVEGGGRWWRVEEFLRERMKFLVLGFVRGFYGFVIIICYVGLFIGCFFLN